MSEDASPADQQWAVIFNEYGMTDLREVLWSTLEAFNEDNASSVEIMIQPADGDDGYDVAVSQNNPDQPED